MTDINSLSILMNTLGYKTTVEDMTIRVSNIFLQVNCHTLVACYNGEVTGMIGASHHLFYEQNGTYVRIAALVTLPVYRRMGIGSALLDAVNSWAKEIGAVSILLNCGTKEERIIAHEFYGRRGFIPISTGYQKKL